MKKEKQLNPWLDFISREAGIRKSLIIHGNIDDICLNPKTQEYEPIIKTIIDQLKTKGFDEVVVWDKYEGINYKFGKKEKISEIIKDTLTSCNDEENVSSNNEDMSCEDYIFDDEAMSNGSSNFQQDNLNSVKEPADFFSTVCKWMTRRKGKSVAFVVDWSNYLFGGSNNLSENDRELLTMLGKSIRDSDIPMNKSNIEKPSNLVVLFSNNLANIPPIYYHNNPMIKEILVPVPSRKEREGFVRDHLHMLRVSNKLDTDPIEFSDFVDMMDGFTLRDIQQIIKLSRQLDETLSVEKLVNLYRYGEKDSPWEELSKEKLIKIEEMLKKRVKGQDEAVKKVKDVIIRAYTGFSGIQHSSKQKKPKGMLFFVGPTGVGKTELAKSLAEFLFGDENACIRFDMSEFNHEHSDQRLVGAPPGYVGYERGGELTNTIKEKPFCVLLFDEIEKADGKILDKFLQILEDGRLTDGKGETVYFSEAIIIFTSNIGASEVSIELKKNERKELFKEKVRNHFVYELKRPEILNRIGDNIVVFNHIEDEDFMVAIVKSKLEALVDFINEKYRMGIEFEDEEKALRAIVGSVDKTYGGRGILNIIEPRIIDPLSEFIFNSSDYFYPGRVIKIVQAGDLPYFAFRLED